MRRLRPAMGHVFVLPYALFFVVLVAYPLGFAVFLAFQSWDVVSPDMTFVGLDNVTGLVTDTQFWNALWNNVRFLLYNVPVTVVCAMGLALLLHSVNRGRSFFRAAFFLPYITSTVVVALVWKWLYAPEGPLNGLLAGVGVGPQQWLSDPALATPAIAVTVAWKYLGLYVLLYLAGLQQISQNVYDAAKTDGAGAFQRFRHVTLPLLRPVTSLVVILSTIVGFQVFTEPYIMTGGGPLDSTTTVVLYIYQTAFQSLRFGYAAAVGLALVVVLTGVVLVQRRLLEPRD